MSDTASSVDSIAISPADVDICQHPDGRAWVLGAGHFGKVGPLNICLLTLRHVASICCLERSRAVVEPELKAGYAGVLGPLARAPRCGDQAADLLCRRDAAVRTGGTNAMWPPLTVVSTMLLPRGLQEASTLAVASLQRKEINILKRVSFNRNVVQFYGFCLDETAPMLVRASDTCNESWLCGSVALLQNLAPTQLGELYQPRVPSSHGWPCSIGAGSGASGLTCFTASAPPPNFPHHRAAGDGAYGGR